jgi:hypothetical protein
MFCPNPKADIAEDLVAFNIVLLLQNFLEMERYYRGHARIGTRYSNHVFLYSIINL